MRIELSGQQRAELGELFLRLQLATRDMERLRTMILKMERKLIASLQEVIGGVETDKIKPVFEEYRLVALEVPEQEVKEDGADAPQE